MGILLTTFIVRTDAEDRKELRDSVVFVKRSNSETKYDEVQSTGWEELKVRSDFSCSLPKLWDSAANPNAGLVLYVRDIADQLVLGMALDVMLELGTASNNVLPSWQWQEASSTGRLVCAPQDSLNRH